MSENITIVTDATFAQEVLQSQLPVLVDFWAEWCGPCKMLAPTLEAVAKDFAGKVKIAKVNVDDSGKTAADYDIRSIPTLLLFKAGKLVANKVGAMTKVQLIEFLNANI